jgi:hypothetical protein
MNIQEKDSNVSFPMCKPKIWDMKLIPVDISVLIIQFRLDTLSR